MIARCITATVVHHADRHRRHFKICLFDSSCTRHGDVHMYVSVCSVLYRERDAPLRLHFFVVVVRGRRLVHCEFVASKCVHTIRFVG